MNELLPTNIINHIMEYTGIKPEKFNFQLCEEYLRFNDIQFDCVSNDDLFGFDCCNNYIDDLYQNTYCDCGTTLAVFNPNYVIKDWFKLLQSQDYEEFGYFFFINCDESDEPDWG